MTVTAATSTVTLVVDDNDDYKIDTQQPPFRIFLLWHVHVGTLHGQSACFIY